jgi:small-conductance mechanosensitive channel
VEGFLDQGLRGLFTPERTLLLVRAVIIFLAGMFFARLASSAVGKVLRSHGRGEGASIAKRITFYTLAFLVIAATLHQLGFNLSVLFGAAGVLTVGIGFASQTSASNLISGLFLIAERSFVVGDTIQIGEHNGEVLSIDLLSVKLRTADNVLVRVPNEEIIKSRIRNLTRFPIRRSDTLCVVAHSTDLERLREAFHAAAAANPRCLVDPPPQCWVRRFAETGSRCSFPPGRANRVSPSSRCTFASS